MKIGKANVLIGLGLLVLLIGLVSPRYTELVIVDTDSTSRWGAVDGTMSLDTIDKVEGSASIRLTATGTGEYLSSMLWMAFPDTQEGDFTLEPLLSTALKTSEVLNKIHFSFVTSTPNPDLGDAPWTSYGFNEFTLASTNWETKVFDMTQPDDGGSQGEALPYWALTPDLTKVKQLYWYYVTSTRIGAFTLNIDNVYSTPSGPLPDHILTVLSPTGGTVDPVAGTYTYTYGTVVTVTATPNSGYYFQGFTLDGTDVGQGTPSAGAYQYDVTMTADHTIEAVFTLTPPTQFAVLIQTDGTGLGTTDPAPGTWTYSEGTTVSITATASSGSQFIQWTYDSQTSTSPTLTLTVDKAYTVIATFDLLPPSTFVISGIVTSTDGTPIEGVLVTATSTIASYDVTTDINGLYNLPVLDGTYVLTFVLNGYDPRSLNVVVSGLDVSGQDIALVPIPIEEPPIIPPIEPPVIPTITVEQEMIPIALQMGGLGLLATGVIIKIRRRR